MFRALHSLRFRLPAIFLAGVVVAGLVATALSVRLFQQYTLHRTEEQLRREATGISDLYAQLTGINQYPTNKTVERATGDHVFFVPRVQGLISDEISDLGLRRLPYGTVDTNEVDQRQVMLVTNHVPGLGKVRAAAAPLRTRGNVWGALLVGTPASELRSRWLTLIDRLALAFAGGVLVAGALGWYLSRRITRPVLALSDAADEIARGNYDVELPKTTSDEIGHLAGRFREMAARLAEAEELERNFLMTVSHELRTPLTAIRGHVAALRDGVIDDEELEEQSLGVVALEAERLERLVQDILDLAKLDARRFTVHHEEVDMGALVERAHAAFAEEARRRGIEFALEVEEAPVIATDGDRVLQIITNLLANAFRWTPDGGSVRVVLAADDGHVSVTVVDTGPGISKHDRDRIFRAFYTRDDAGTGLGLAIARELAVALGGRIDLESELGVGSRFELRLPARRIGPGDVYPASAEPRRSSIR
jgi:two-component system sensor histidine kinase BaeS